MKILAILGSPRKGNSEILLNEATKLCEKKGHKVTIIKACQLKISGCTACDGCKDTGQCIIQDDMDRIYPLLKDSHRIIIASPIFFFGIPGQLKLLIDRCQSLWYEKYVLKKTLQTEVKKKALVILVGGMKKGATGVKCAEETLKAFLRTINVKEHQTLSYLGFNEPGEILGHSRAVKDVVNATEELIKND